MVTTVWASSDKCFLEVSNHLIPLNICHHHTWTIWTEQYRFWKQCIVS